MSKLEIPLLDKNGKPLSRDLQANGWELYPKELDGYQFISSRERGELPKLYVMRHYRGDDPAKGEEVRITLGGVGRHIEKLSYWDKDFKTPSEWTDAGAIHLKIPQARALIKALKEVLEDE